jgi:AraC-like DNA-binding protein
VAKFLTNLDLQKNELQNARLQNLATAPASPVEGQLYYDTALDVVRVYANGAWASLSTGSGTVTAVTGTGAISSTGGTTPEISIADGTTSVKGAVQLEDSTSSTSTTKAATPASVKSAYDLASGKASPSDVHYIGTTSVALNRTSANLALTGISSVTLPGSTSGTAQVVATAIAGTGTVITLPATTGTVALTSDIPSLTGYVTETGSQTLTNKTLTAPIVDGAGVVFEGATADAYETTLTVVDPTADRTITLPNATGTVALIENKLSAFAATSSSELAGVISDETGTGALVFANSPVLNGAEITNTGGTPRIHGVYLPDGHSITFEGATTDEFETTLTVADPSADRTITLPNATGTVALTADKLSAFAATSSSELAGVISDETGTGALVFANTPTLVTPNIGAATGTSLVLSGDLTVNGTTTTINSTTVTVDDKNIELGSVATPSDATADGGGITLRGTTDKTINWVDATDAWTLSEHVNIASGKVYRINGTEVLSGTTLGSGVTGSSLTSVGTIATGTWNGTAIAIANGGTGQTTASAARDALAESGFTIARKKAGTATWTAGEAKAITHSLGSKDITVGVYDASDELVYAEVVATSTTVATITISLAGTYRYAIIG